MCVTMTMPENAVDVVAVVSRGFSDAQIRAKNIEVREYPEESIVVVRVEEADLTRAIDVGNALDRQLAKAGFRGFVTVRQAELEAQPALRRAVTRLNDPRVAQLVQLVTARSRTSETQPSLSYVPDVENNLSTATAARHHLVFGRRGAGKTALLVEAKRIVEEQGHLSVWLNMHTYRREPAARMFLVICERLCELIRIAYRSASQVPAVLTSANAIHDEADRQLAAANVDETQVRRLVPRMQSMMRRFLDVIGKRLYVFLDDFHYFDRAQQPLLLDMVHGAIRDCDAWMKVAAIEHLARWFEPRSHLGLETGHDAAHIDLDVTLQNPSSAAQFLERVLLSYAQHYGVRSLSSILSRGALERLVLASGAVPRDYLVLCANAIQQAQQRENAHQVGAQDVNKAAGDAKQKKIDELEDDAASSGGESQEILSALQRVRAFCIDERSWTFFRVDFRDKEERTVEYNVMQVLANLRLIHLIEPSLSDERRAGHRSEVYMLDLSQFAGQRLKRKLRVLDFDGGHFVLKETGTRNPAKIGDTANKRLGLLRRAPVLPLELLGKSVAQSVAP